MRLGIATALLSMGLMGCKNTIMGSWKAVFLEQVRIADESLRTRSVSRYPRLYSRSR